MTSRILTTLSETRVPFIREEVINAMTSRVSLAREQVPRLNVGQPSQQKNTQSFSSMRVKDVPIFQRPSFYHRHNLFLSTLRKRNYAPLVTSHVQRRYYSTHQSSNKEGLLVSTKRYFGTFCGMGALALASTLFCTFLFGNEQDKSGEPQILETALNQALKQRKFEEARQLLTYLLKLK